MIKRFLVSSAALLIAGAATGCRTVPLDPSGELVAVYQFGEFQMLFNGPSGPVVQATERALQQLELFQTGISSDKFEAEIRARTRGDQRVSIRIREANSQQTLVSIRWGEAGNLKNSRRLYEAIEANMK